MPVASSFKVAKLPEGSVTVPPLTASDTLAAPSVKVVPDQVADVPSRFPENANP